MDIKMFGIIKYSSIYCKMDCKVLMEGYEVFRGWVLEQTNIYIYIYIYIYIDDLITIQSLASSFMLKSGCCKDVYQVSGAIQQFISKYVVGGRVMTNSNKQYHVKKEFADFDACSSYPGAMFYMEGFLKGKPKVLSDKSYEFLKKARWIFR